MLLEFLPQQIRFALDNLNYNYLTEIRLRSGQAVIIEYRGEYKYINGYGATDKRGGALLCDSAEEILQAATGKNIFVFTEQLKRGFITLGGGIRIGVAGEYVTDGGKIISVKRVSSLNVRLPHNAIGCAEEIYAAVFNDGVSSALIFSSPGYGKTTVLRDLARLFSRTKNNNILIFDERNEIYATDDSGRGYDVGECCDVVSGADKLSGFENAIRAMKPQIIITDELYGDKDMAAIRYATDCGIAVVASSHVTNKSVLRAMPFEHFVELTGVGKRAIVYDKNFNTVCDCSTVRNDGSFTVRR